jgi:RND family efflux transporter MFP subunit
MDSRTASKWLALLLMMGGALGCATSPTPTATLPPPDVKVSLPLTKVVTDYEDFPGRTEALFSIDVQARVTGYLEKVHFTEGELVAKDAVLVDIDARPYQAELERADAALAQARAHKDRLEADFKRASVLFARGNLSREEYDKVTGDRAEAVAAVGVAEANRKVALLNLSFTRVTAPISGRISRVYRDPGNLIKADNTVLTNIVSQDPMCVTFDLDERTALRLKQVMRESKTSWSQNGGLSVRMGLADEKGYPRQGVIDFRDNRLDADTGTWRLRARFENANETLTPGLFVRVHLPIGSAYSALVVAEQALSTDQGQKFVYVLEGDNTVSSRLVKVGQLHDGLRVIKEGLKGHERILVSGLQRVRAGITVNPRLIEMPSAPASAPANKK